MVTNSFCPPKEIVYPERLFNSIRWGSRTYGTACTRRIKRTVQLSLDLTGSSKNNSLLVYTAICWNILSKAYTKCRGYICNGRGVWSNQPSMRGGKDRTCKCSRANRTGITLQMQIMLCYWILSGEFETQAAKSNRRLCWTGGCHTSMMTLGRQNSRSKQQSVLGVSAIRTSGKRLSLSKHGSWEQAAVN